MAVLHGLRGAVLLGMHHSPTGLLSGLLIVHWACGEVGLSDDRRSSVSLRKGALDFFLLPPCWRAWAPGNMVGHAPEVCFDRPF